MRWRACTHIALQQLALVVAPMYTAELVPPERRGGLVAMCDVSTNLGILMG